MTANEGAAFLRFLEKNYPSYAGSGPGGSDLPLQRWKELRERQPDAFNEPDDAPSAPAESPPLAPDPRNFYSGSGARSREMTLALMGGPHDVDAILAARHHGIAASDLTSAQILRLRGQGMSWADIAALEKNRTWMDGRPGYHTRVKWDAKTNRTVRD